MKGIPSEAGEAFRDTAGGIGTAERFRDVKALLKSGAFFIWAGGIAAAGTGPAGGGKLFVQSR